jgi:hypothetical protein
MPAPRRDWCLIVRCITSSAEALGSILCIVNVPVDQFELWHAVVLEIINPNSKS